MKDFDQTELYKIRNSIKQEINPLGFEKIQFSYINRFLRSERKNIFILVFIIFLITAIEISIPIFLHFLFKKFSYVLDIDKLYYTFGFFILLLLIFIYLNYIGIEKQKVIIIKFINLLRKDWLKIYLNKSISGFSNKDKGKIFVKISYHFSLLQMGLNNSFFMFFQWLMFSFGLLIATTIIDFRLLIISLLCLPFNFLILYAGYLISTYYVSQDQTLYSKILQYVSDIFNNIFFIKIFNKEEFLLSHLDKMVELDSYFRVKREILLTLGNKIIFVLITIFSASLFLFNIYFPFLNFEGAIQALVYAIVIFLQIKLMYLSLRIGLFSFPLKLGLILSVPNKNPNVFSKNKDMLNFSKISFYSKKTKINRFNSYHKDIIFNFEKGNRYVINGDEGSGKSTLANIFTGIEKYKIGRSWIVKVDQKRFLYKDWIHANKKVLNISPYFYPEISIFNLMNGKHDIEFLKKYEVFDFVFDQKRFTGSVLNKNLFSFAEIGIMQILMAILYNPDIVVVDNIWRDLNHSKLNKALDILSENLKDKIIIEFSNFENTNITYDKFYKI